METRNIPVFDSRDPRYRTPVGAVIAGTAVSLTVRPESSRFPLRGYLCLEYDDNGETLCLVMTHHGREGDREVFTVTLQTGNRVGLIWYRFRFENEGGFFFYGNNPQQSGGNCEFYATDHSPKYQLTVYDGAHKTPDWFGEGICYHIFPDRFCRLDTPDANLYADRERIIHGNWEDTPIYRPEPNGEVTNRDFFGGSLDGIRTKLDRLAGMGVTCLYLSPIFAAYSNHRYDTADYGKIDPMLGDEASFALLCAEARKRDIRILLDGVFNHTGSDSIYFNKTGRYPQTGAYQSKDSPYYLWYTFTQWPDEYEAWWGIKTLPKVRADHPGFAGFIASDRESIVRRWIAAGAAGWRLDVADELTDEFLRKIGTAAREESSDAVVIGEVWEDASNKVSYGVRRKYLLGGALDSVTNYPFRTAVIEYLTGGPSSAFREKMECLAENYPPFALRSAMNILGTHDTVRILSVLDGNPEGVPADKDRRAEYRMSRQGKASAKRRLKIGALLQYCVIGCPTVYYGDEAGMEGFEDPLNRRGYCWGKEDQELLCWYRRLGEARKRLKALRRGGMRFLDTCDAIIAFARVTEGHTVIAACNRSGEGLECMIPQDLIPQSPAAFSFVDFMSGEIPEYRIIENTGEIAVMLEPERAYLLAALPPSGHDWEETEKEQAQ